MSNIVKSQDIKVSDIYYMEFNIDEKKNKTDQSIVVQKGKTGEKDYENKLKKIVEEANKRADEIIKEAKESAGILKKEAYEKGLNEGLSKGFEDGYKSGYDAGLKEADSLIKEAALIKKQIELERENLLNNLESDVISLVYNCVVKIIGEIKIEDKIMFTVKNALDNMKIRDSYTIRLSHDDYIIMQSYIQKERINEKYKFIDDIALKKGDIIIDTPNGEINVGYISQLKKLKNELRSLLLDESKT